VTDDHDLRPEMVARLTATRALPQDLVDDVLDASDAERAAAADVILERTRAHLVQAGVLRPSIGVLDLRYRTVAALAATLGTVGGVWVQPAYQDRPLGDVLKVVDPARAAWVMGVLRWGGLLPPE
jgi:hypothetical protein